MSIQTVGAAARFVFDNQLASADFTVVWHAGEPLVVQPDWYRRAIASVQAAACSDIKVPHAIQTNGTLIDDRWCDLFLETGMRVGVSLDGPAWLHDARRKTRSGIGTHAKVMRGIDFLRRRGVSFHIICVVGAKTLNAPDELMDFFEAEDIRNVGFNIEEIEGPVTHSSLEGDSTRQTFTGFLERVIHRALTTSPAITIRERDDLLASLESSGFGNVFYNSQNAPLGIVTVSSRGEVFTFSPELAGLVDDRYGNFSIGALPDITLSSALSSPVFGSMWRDIQDGVRKCSENCDYFDVCLGGAPVNKLSENKSFATTETMFCQLAHQSVADVVLTEIVEHLRDLRGAQAPSIRVRSNV